MKCGFYEKEITPPLGQSLPGYFCPRPAMDVWDKLYAKSAVFEGENGIVAVQDTPGFAAVMEQLLQFPLPGAGQLIGIAVGSDVGFLQSREVPVQMAVEILPVPVPQG